MTDDNLTGINRIPNEILIGIFLSLAPESIMACRAVCRRWQQILDDDIISDKLWYKYCKTYHSNIYESAHIKSLPGLRWYELYVSLTLWSRLSLTQETIHEINFKNSNLRFCSDFQVLRNGIIGVLTKSCIVYYNVDTLQPTQELLFTDSNAYFTYTENDTTLLLLSVSDQLFVRRTSNNEAVINTFDDVFLFLLLENVIYYVTNSSTIFKCDFIGGSYTSTRLVEVPEKVLALGHDNDTPYVLTNTDTIYSFVNNALIKVPMCNYFQNKWETISKFNFSGNSGWKNMCTYSVFSSLCKKNNDYLEVYKIFHVRIHGPVVIVGYGKGILRIFNSAYTTSLTDLLDSTPSKEYYLFKPHEYEPDDVIFNIDVVEGYRSHFVIVAMREKIVIIRITHSQNSEKPSYSLQKTTNGEVMKTKQQSKNTRELASSSRQITTFDGELLLKSRKDSSSSGETLPKIKKRSC